MKRLLLLLLMQGRQTRGKLEAGSHLFLVFERVEKDNCIIRKTPILTYLSSSIWASPAQTLVNAVNAVRSGIHRSLSMSRQGFEPQKQAHFP